MKLLNFGSLNIDYVYSVAHFVRPGETLPARDRTLHAGGKGLNQSIAAARAGAPVCHAGKIGSDGRMLVDLLNKAGVDTRRIAQSRLPTGHAIIQVDPAGQNGILTCAGANSDLGTAYIDTVLSDFHRGDLLLLQNETSDLPYLLQTASSLGLQIALNPSPIDNTLLACPLETVRWFLLNEIEGNALTGETDPDAILDAMRRRYPHAAVVLTLGRQGVVYADGTGRKRHGVYRVRPVDTTAAGDTFTGYFLAGLYENLPMREILRRASVASSLAVSRPGASASIPTIEEVLRADLQAE